MNEREEQEKARAMRMAEIVQKMEEVDRSRREVAKEFKEQLVALHKELSSLAGDELADQMSIDDRAGDDSAEGPALSLGDRAVRKIIEKAREDGLEVEVELSPLRKGKR